MMDPKKLALGAGAAILTSGLIGGAAFAAFAPVTPISTATSVAEPGLTTTAGDEARKPGGLKTVLDKMVAAKTITQEQEDKILAAVKDAAGANGGADHAAKGVFGELMKTATAYLGLDAKALATQLHSGKSLGEIADGTTGKSRGGLVAALTTAANTKIDAAVKENKLTAEQATKLRAGLGAHIAQIVDHKAGPRPPKKP